MKMWRRLLGMLLILVSVNVGQLSADGGNPFFRNYLPSVYNAHNRNFDIVTDDYGRVIVANFEGLLYYDQSSWHTIHAPGIYRFTTLYKDHSGRIWFGGYNLFGYLSANKKGELILSYLFSEKNEGFLGDVASITEVNGMICLETPIGREKLPEGVMNDYLFRKTSEKKIEMFNGFIINQQILMPDGSKLLATAGAGFIVLNKRNEVIYALSEQNGLCDNNVNSIYADKLGYVWGATDKGLFLVNVNTAYTFYGPSEGLKGEVQSICNTSNAFYVGTLRGLFRKKMQGFEQVSTINSACWQLTPNKKGGVWAGTARGLYEVTESQTRQLTNNHTVSFYVHDDDNIYTGEIDGVYHLRRGVRKPLNSIEKVTNFIMEGDSVLWARNIFGRIFRCRGDKTHPELLEVKLEGDEEHREAINNNMFEQDGQIYVVSHLGVFVWNSQTAQLQKVADTKYREDGAYEYPQFVYPDPKKQLWATNRLGKKMTVYSQSQHVSEINEAIRPLDSYVIQCMEQKNNHVWFGGTFGLIQWDNSLREPDFGAQNSLYIRRIVLDNNTVLWGGFNIEDEQSSRLPMEKMRFQDGLREVRIEYSTDKMSTLGEIQYSYRIDENENWSAWSTKTSAVLVNPRPGMYHFEVRARDRYGRITEPVGIHVTIENPIYLRWYSWIAYAILLTLFILFLIKWRMRRLLHEKERLEAIVESRTSQIRQQKDEIEEKSKNLEQALDDLNKAQFELIRQEKMATVGTLTQGLVDRILNPMNYVNNFSHMSIGLLGDMKQNVDDDKEKMTPDIYEDSLDLLDMLTTNLQKIEEHGLNTTRILKAMEEMLKERTGKMSETDIAALCRKNIEMLGSYNEKDIQAAHIQLVGPDEDLSITAEVDAEQLSKTVMSLLTNSIYAVKKKVGRVTFEPTIRLSVTLDGGNVHITAYDNGIGIEQSIVDKIFDPFFTTKTTAEAVGVGLYISREVIRNHGGDMSVKSVKDEYTEFDIVIPVNQEK